MTLLLAVALASCAMVDEGFEAPALRAWRHRRSALVARHTPHHSADDHLVGLAARPALRAKLHYGDLRKDLEDEDVALYVRDADGGAWTHVGDARTDDDGRVALPFPCELVRAPGTWRLRFVVYGDGTSAEARLRVLAGATPAAVLDVDGTLSTADSEAVKEALAALVDRTYVPAAHAGAAALAQRLDAAGYELVYVTARPYWLAHATRVWLAREGFPPGTLCTSPSTRPARGERAVAFKRATLARLAREGARFRYAFGNALSDVAAYAAAGIPLEATHLIGLHAGAGGTVAVASWLELLASFTPAPLERDE